MISYPARVITATSIPRSSFRRSVKEIYERLVASGEQNIVVLGDFNDTPSSAQHRPLVKQTDLKDISAHPQHQTRPIHAASDHAAIYADINI